MITIYTLLMFLAMIVLAFFTASEMAFTSVNRIKLKSRVESGDQNALKLTSFLKEGTFLGTTLVGTNIAVVIMSAFATRIFAEHFGAQSAAGLAIVVMVPATLVFAEIIPKMIARQFSTPLAMNAVMPLMNFHRLFYPLIVFVDSAAKMILAPFGKRRASWEGQITKSDLKRLLLLGHETGEVEADEVELIYKILEFGAKTVNKIMVPLYRISSISVGDSAEDLKKLASVTGFSRIPVYSQNKNNIIGIANIYDILFSMEEDADKSRVKDLVREPVHVSKNDGLDIALARLRHRKQPMGIVTDENDRVVGIITIEDILEEIVGEIEDRG